MTGRCEKCGAAYAFESGGRCVVPEDGGALCGGRILPPQATISVDPAHGSDSTVRTLVDVSGRVHGVPLPDAVVALLSRVVMRRGAVYPHGEATAVLEFRTEDDRATFASWIALAGGRLSV